MLEPVEEQAVNLGDVKDRVHRDALFEGLEHGKDPAVILIVQPLQDRGAAQRRAVQGVQGNLCPADGLHEGFLKGLTDGHDFAGRFHLSTERAAGTGKLVKGPLRELADDIVDGRLKAGTGFSGDIVRDFIQGVPQRNARGDFGNRVAGRLGGERGGTRYARINLNHGILEGIGVQGELTVAAADNPDGRDHIKCCTAQQLIFLV